MKKIIKQYAHDFRGISLSQFQLEDIFARCLIECLESEEVKYNKTEEDYNKDSQALRMQKVNFLINLKRELTELLSPVSDKSECLFCNVDVQYKHMGKEEIERVKDTHFRTH